MLFGAVYVAILLPRASLAPADLLWFVAGLSVLKLSDVWLPRGDAIGMSSALALGALLLFDARFVLAALVIAEVVALVPPGRERKWRAALGALAAEAIATSTCSLVLVSVGLHPQTAVLTRARSILSPNQYIFILLVGLLFAALEYGLLQTEMAVRDRRPIGASILGSLSYGGWLIAAQSSAGVLVALMYRTMSAWGLLVSVVMILVMRQSFVLLLDIRQAYDSTIGVLVKAMEAQSPGREGVAARNAELSVQAGRALGMHGNELERVRYAALLLGLGADECEADTASARLTDSSRIIQGVEFLEDVTPVLRLCDNADDVATARRSDLTCSYLVTAIAAATDTIPRQQLERLRSRVSPRIIRETDNAVAQAVAESANLSSVQDVRLR